MSATRLPSAVRVSRVGAVHDRVKKRIILTSNNRIDLVARSTISNDKTVIYRAFNRRRLRTSAPLQRGHEHYVYVYMSRTYI